MTPPDRVLATEQPAPSPGGAMPTGVAEDQLTWPEVSYRGGLLLGAGIFFFEALGAPMERGLFGIAAGLLSLLLVVTMALQWRILGDWRDGRVLGLLAGMAAVLMIPIAAGLSPSLGGSGLPEGFEEALTKFLDGMKAVPGMGAVIGFLKAIISFLLVLMLIVLMLLGGGGGKRGGIYLAGGILTALVLFFHPTVETIIGFLFLGMFIHAQWELALIIPKKVRDALTLTQRDFLRALLRQGGMSPGETRLWLEGNANAFGQLLDLGLVEYDRMIREVVPGHRLIHDPAAAALESALSVMRRVTWFAVGILYFFLPDLIPGPVDDLVILALTSGAGLGFFGQGLREVATRRRPGRPM